MRYADDFCVFFKCQADLEDFKRLLVIRFAQFGLTIADDKTHSTNLDPTVPDRERRRITFLGFNILMVRARSGRSFVPAFATENKRFTRACHNLKDNLRRIRHWHLKDQCLRINQILRGHINYYGLAGNARAIGRFHHIATKLWLRSLGDQSQRGRKSWAEYTALLKKYPLVHCRIPLNYSRLTSFVKL